MAADSRLLEGEIGNDSASEEKDVEALLMGFLNALIEEQKLNPKKEEAA